MGYEIKVLSSDDFDELPYEGIEDSLGFADVKHGKVFVRNTGSHEMNRYLINHEIDHLVEDHATDEDAHGIRHKKFFKDIVAPFSYNPGYIFGGNDKKNNKENDARVAAQQQQDQQQQQLQSLLSSGNQGSPMNQFSVSGQKGAQNLPGNFDSSVGSRLNQGSLTGSGLNGGGENSISPDILQRIYGYYSGRTTF